MQSMCEQESQQQKSPEEVRNLSSDRVLQNQRLQHFVGYTIGSHVVVLKYRHWVSSMQYEVVEDVAQLLSTTQVGIHCN